jgi:phosphate transport system substrate-binding protein
MTTPRPFVLLAAIVVGCSISSCSRTAEKPAVASATDKEHHVLRGAGSTFAAPLYYEWQERFQEANPNILIEYAAIGSGEGESRFRADDVDFGATDAAVTEDQFAQVERGALVVPIAAGSIVIAYNSEGLPDGLQLPRDVYVDIFLGRIINWNDARIAAANPGVTLPKLPIHRIVRLDSSGTTYAFTNHLSAISEAWRAGPGVGKQVAWPDVTINVPGNDSVAGRIKEEAGGIGYVEFGTARLTGLRMARLENRSGKFIKPSDESGSVAITIAETTDDISAALRDPADERAYPIVTLTWMLLYRHYDDPNRATMVKDFAEWCLSDGQKYNQSLGYVSLSPGLASAAAHKLESIGK